MNFNQIFTQIEKTDPEVYERLDSRRNAIRNISSKIALTAVPFLLGGMFKKAYAGDKKLSSVSDVLNFALTLEYLEASFYKKANETLFSKTPTPPFKDSASMALYWSACNMMRQVFYPAEEYHQNYLQKHPQGYTCHRIRNDWKF